MQVGTSGLSPAAALLRRCRLDVSAGRRSVGQLCTGEINAKGNETQESELVGTLAPDSAVDGNDATNGDFVVKV